MFRLVLTIFYATLCAKEYPMHSPSHPISVIVDSDSNLDDLLAITYLVKSSNSSVKAITTTGTGIAHWEYAPRNVLDLLKLLHHPKIPVAFGARRSLSPVGTPPASYRDQASQVIGITLPHNSYSPSRIPSAALMGELLQSAPKPMTILALGPLTNIALMLKHDPTLARKIKEIYFVGGAINVPGNIDGKFGESENDVSEYKVALDTEAAKIVLASRVPLTLIPLDLTNKVPITRPLMKQLEDQKRTDAANFVYDVLRKSEVAQVGIVDSFGDTVGAVLVTNPDIATYRKMRLNIVTEKGGEYGRVFVSKNGYPVKVATTVDAERFNQIFFETINAP